MSKKILTVVGARPQFIKAAPVSRMLRREAQEVLVHTGQHYDPDMSDIFFRELHIPQPDYSLEVGSGRHGEQTGAMLARLEEVMLQEKPDWVLVYGDTNSTLAGALAAAKLHLPVAHVEAGLRSFNRRMPEEINRVMADHLAQVLFAPTRTAVDNLVREGFTSIAQGGELYREDPPGAGAAASTAFPAVVNSGDVMLDALNFNRRLAEAAAAGLFRGEYYLATVHRAENTDRPETLAAVLEALASLDRPVILPLHPRTRDKSAELGLGRLLGAPPLRVEPPAGYLKMLALQENAAAVITDSGGMQKEAYFLGVPCVTLREETEWPETLVGGWNRLVPPGPGLKERLRAALAEPPRDRPREGPFGDGEATGRIVRWLLGG